MSETDATIDAQLKLVKSKVGYINFFLPQVRNVIHLEKAMNDAIRHNAHRHAGTKNSAEAKLEIAKKELENWLAQMKELIRQVESFK